MGNTIFTFLICSERSGSNLITRIFDSHPYYCGPSPSHLIRAFANNRFGYGDLSKNENWEIFVSDIADYLGNQLGKWRTAVTAQNIMTEVHERRLAAVIKYVYKREAHAHGKPRIFVKENQTFRFIPFLLLSFPEGKFVYQVRDPRDMALSWKISPSHPGGVHKGANVWKEDQARGLEIYGYLRDSDLIVHQRYEDLISQPESQLRTLCNFLNIPYDEAMLSFHRQDLSAENANRITGWANLSKPVISDNSGKYHGKLAELEIRYIEALCQREMEFFNYQPDFAVDNNLAVLEKEVLAYEADNLESASLDQEEQVIRNRRLTVIDRIIKRKLWQNW